MLEVSTGDRCEGNCTLSRHAEVVLAAEAANSNKVTYSWVLQSGVSPMGGQGRGIRKRWCQGS